MQKLKEMLPKDCKPIIVTDAGFRNPWFTLVESLGWDFVDKVRNKPFCKKKRCTTWLPFKSLYQLGTLRPKDLGQYQQGIKQSFESRMVVVWRKPKGRKDKTTTGELARISKKSRACAKREKEPWLLATFRFAILDVRAIPFTHSFQITLFGMSYQSNLHPCSFYS
jgi:hypothetical protein